MNVIFMGTPDFSVETLKAIVNAGHTVSAVVTQPDKPKGRGGAMHKSPVKEAALFYGLTVLQPEKAKDPEFIETLRKYNPDVIVVVAFGQFLPEEILSMPKYGCVNVHASLLPKYRGASPIQWAVINGEEYSGVTTMMMAKGIDTGDILEVSKLKLDEKETGDSLFDRLSVIGGELLVKTLADLEQDKVTPLPQNNDEATYVKMMDKSFGLIDFKKSAVKIERLIRGLNSWPSAFTFYNGKMLKIWDADVVKEDSDVESGVITAVGKDTFVVKCGQDSLAVKEVQLEGKKRMKTGDFLRGNHMEEGEKLSESR